jgi:hypothetical protein
VPELLIIDPLTLMGREFLQLLEGEPHLAGAVTYRHTVEDDEHQIAELAGQPSLVPPLDETEDFPHCSAILVASDSGSPRFEHLVRHVEAAPATPVVDMSRSSLLRDWTLPATGVETTWPTHHLHVAHPALVALSILAGAVRHLGPVGGILAAVDPVSTLGRGAVESLARQSSRRLQGEPVVELIDEKALAFNLVTSADDDLNEDAAALLPDLDLSVTRAMYGCFHGHVAHIGLGFSQPLDEQEVMEAIESDRRIAHQEPPLSLDNIPESDSVLLQFPRISRDRRYLATTAMVDGLRIGGALTALEILQAILEPSN